MLVGYLFQEKLVTCQVHFVSVSLWILTAKRKEEDCLPGAVLVPPVYGMLEKSLFRFLFFYSYFN